MRRIAGFAMLLSSALLFAYQRNAHSLRQLEALRGFNAMLEQLEGILSAQAPPMPELLQLLHRRCEGAAGYFIGTLGASMDRLGERSFWELWKESLNAVSDELEEDMLQALGKLGDVLGRYDLPTQLQAIGECRTILRERTESREKSRPQAARLTLGLSLSAALLLGIVLI